MMACPLAFINDEISYLLDSLVDNLRLTEPKF